MKRAGCRANRRLPPIGARTVAQSCPGSLICLSRKTYCEVSHRLYRLEEARRGIQSSFKTDYMLKHIRMPLVVKALCGATIGFLLGLYVANNYFGGAIHYVVYLLTLGGAIGGVWLLRR